MTLDTQLIKYQLKREQGLYIIEKLFRFRVKPKQDQMDPGVKANMLKSRA